MRGLSSRRRTSEWGKDEEIRMKLIFKYLKPFALVVVLCVALLFGQAMCDLSLPNLMSDIVTVGIQQGGIDESLPDAISQKGMQLISFFMGEGDRAAFQGAYALVEPGSDSASAYEKEYPLLGSEALYVRTAQDKDALANAGEIYGRSAYSLMSYLKSMAEQSGQDMALDEESGVADVDMGQLYALIPLLQSLPAETFAPFIESSAQLDSMIYQQVGVTFTKLFYGELGMDLAAVQRASIWSTGLKMLGVALAGVIAAIGVGYISSKVAARVSQRMRRDIFAKVESFGSAEFNGFSTASLITRTTNDVQQMQMLITMGLRIMCYAPIMGVGGVIFAVGKSVSMSWIIALGVIILLGLILVIFALAMPKFKSLQKLIDKLNLVSRESLSGMLVVRAFGNEQHEEERFEQANRNLNTTQRYVQRVMSFMMPAMMFMMNGITLLIVWVGGHAIADSTMQIGDMMAFMQYAMQIIMSFLFISMMFIMVPRAMVSANRIAEVLNTELVVKDPENPRSLGKVSGVVEFRDVSFRYSNAERNVLDHISFTALPGQTTAFIGSTGSGKSTLINLLPRFFDVTEGAITIDGVDIREVSQHELRENIGYVPQKGVLFSGDIASNIRYGREDAGVDEVNAAIKTAQAKEFVDGTEHGLETPIAQGGGNVSGGQKQRLAIARALVKKAPIYIFDDSFSALDFKTDAALRKALQEDTRDATVLLVAQRVSTIMNAEQIIVLDGGRAVGIGTHQELLKTCPEYREIAESQLQKEELE